MSESFSSRVNVRDLVRAARRFDSPEPGPVFVNVTIDDHGSLTIAPDAIDIPTLENVPLERNSGT